jgi:spore coat polysaccharide biosynthesis predicted glycosyltransferase SpsG
MAVEHPAIMFLTHASANTGFGHAARCAKLSSLLKKKRPAIETIFTGEFSNEAKHWVEAFGAVDAFASDPSPAAIGVYDRMDDAEDPEVVDVDRVRALRDLCGQVILFANGHSLPRLESGVTVIGYKPAAVVSRPPRVYWSLEFAPVFDDVPATSQRNPHRVFVALGGAEGDRGLRTVCEALRLLPQITEVDVLDSPVNPLEPDPGWLRADQRLATHRRVPSVAPFLAGAGLVVASYGHLAYEALACGSPLCLLGQKAFQARYADKLAARGLCIAGGLLFERTAQQLAHSFGAALAAADTLSAAATRAVDGKGLERVADLIIERLERPT